MKAKYVFESLEKKTNREIIESIINEQVRTSKTRAKLLDYIERIYSFHPEANATIEKKELTKITNELGDILSKYYSTFNDNRNERREDCDALAVIKGYRDCYEATDKHKDPLFQAIQFGAVYGLSYVKRIATVAQIYDTKEVWDFMDKYYPNIHAWDELADKVKQINEALNPTREQKEAKKLQEIKGKVNPEIKKAIDEIAEDFRKVIEKTEYDYLSKQFEKFKSDFPDGIDTEKFYSRLYGHLRAILGGYLRKDEKLHSWEKGNYYLVKDHDEKAKKYAYNTSVDTITRWQRKMYDKLGGFVTELGKKFKTSVIGQKHSMHDIVFNFEDGSRFTINNQIVSKVSPLGNYFYTYPTTFHNAFLPDGSKIAQPSEFTVKDAFNKYSK